MRADIDFDINFLILCCSSHMCFFAGLIFTTLQRTPFWSSPKLGTAIFGCFHIIMAGVQLSSLHHRVWCPTDSFPSFYPTSTPLTVLPANQNLLPIYCWSISILIPSISNYISPGNHVKQPQPTATKVRTHLTWSVYQGTWPAEVPPARHSGPEVNTDPAATIKLKLMYMHKHIYSKTSSQLQPRKWAGPWPYKERPNVP